jgi:hypothetical protein
MTYPLDLEGREAKREQLIRTATEKAIRREQRYMSYSCLLWPIRLGEAREVSGWAGALPVRMPRPEAH